MTFRPGLPLPPADLVPRLPAGPLPQAVVLAAGPGFGKSLALRALVDEAPAAWLACEPDDDAASFFGELVAGVRELVPGFGEAVEALASSERGAPRVVWQHFFRELGSYGLPRFVVALDDAQHLPPDLLQGLIYHLDKLPAGVDVGLATRKRVTGLARLQAKGQVLVVGEPQLRFTPEEAEAFLGGAAPGRWQALDGWPLGLDLLRSGIAVEGEAALREVTEEIVQEQPAERQELLLRAAVLEEFGAEALRRLESPGDVVAHLEALEDAHLVRRHGDAGYRLVGFLQAYMLEEARRVVPPPTRAAWAREAATYLDEAREPERALAHWVAAGAWPEAAAAAERLFPGWRFDGRHGAIARTLATFPADEPIAETWRGHLAARQGDHASARAHYETAKRLFDERDDHAGTFKILVRLCYLALVADDLRAAGPLLLQALGRQAEGRPEDRTDLFLQRAYTAEQRGDMALMRECNLAVLDVAVAGNVEVAASHGIALMNLYTAALHQGDLAAAQGYLDRAGVLFEARGFLPYRVFTAFLALNLSLVRGELPELPPLPDGWRDLLDWHDLACAEAILGYWHEAHGRWREADEALARALTTFETAGTAAGRKLVLERQAWLGLRRGAPERVVAQTAGQDPGESIYDAAYLVPRGRAQQLTGDAAGAVATLEAAVSAFEGLGAHLHQSRALAYLAAARQAAGDAAGAKKTLLAARKAIAAGGHGFLLDQDAAIWREFEAPKKEKAAATADRRLELRCFGAFEVVVDGQRLDKWTRRKSQLILAALALRPRGLSLAELADLVDDEPAGPERLTAVKVAISYLRQALEPDLARGNHSKLVPLNDERYSLATPAFLDVAAFEEAMTRAESAGKPEDAEAAYLEGLAHYKGNLMEAGYLARFFEAEREQLRRRAVAALLWLGARRGEESFYLRATTLAPTDEDAWLGLLAYYAGAGQADRARQAYWDARKSYKKHLNATPGERLEAAHRAVASKAKPVWA